MNSGALARWITTSFGPIETTDATPRDAFDVTLAPDATALQLSTVIDAVDDKTGHTASWTYTYQLVSPPTGGTQLTPVRSSHTTSDAAAAAWAASVSTGAPGSYTWKTTLTGANGTTLRWTVTNTGAANAPPRS